MTDPAVLANQQQRKEVRRKEKSAMSKDTAKEHDEETQEAVHAAIYLCGPKPGDMDQIRDVPSIDQQRLHCRLAATLMRAEVVGEFVDESPSTPTRPGLQDVMTLKTRGQPVTYLIVYSKKCLTRDCDQMFEVAWRLGTDGIAVIATDEHYEAPWTEW
jgi:Resolvase, N terminal domain